MPGNRRTTTDCRRNAEQRRTVVQYSFSSADFTSAGGFAALSAGFSPGVSSRNNTADAVTFHFETLVATDFSR